MMDRLSRSSEETSVMGAERRAGVIQLELPLATLNKRGRDNGAADEKYTDYQTNGMGSIQEEYEAIKEQQG